MDKLLLDVTCCFHLHTLLHVVGSSCICLHTIVTLMQQHAKLSAQQCWELLYPFAHSLTVSRHFGATHRIGKPLLPLSAFVVDASTWIRVSLIYIEWKGAFKKLM